jgi:NADH-quinone oxidoreductase subunit A
MATPTAIVAYLALFAIAGFLFLFANLVLGYFLRPKLPNKEKLEVYECGEPTIGSSFVQFDLRFYVVALLFIIFDVEVAFFFPWATVYGKVTDLAVADAPLLASDIDSTASSTELSSFATNRLRELGIANPVLAPPEAAAGADPAAQSRASFRSSARKLALASFVDIGVFFAVLMIGFAYVWKRGDLNWVRAMSHERRERPERQTPVRAVEPSTSVLSA